MSETKQATPGPALERALLKGQISALGRLVSSLAHDVDGPIGVARSSAGLAREAVAAILKRSAPGQLKEGELEQLALSIDRALGMVEDHLQRGSAAVAQLRQLGLDQADGHVRAIDLTAHVDEALGSLRRLLRGRKVTVRVEGLEPIRVTADPGALTLLVLHLLSDALEHAFPGGAPGSIVFRTGALEGEAFLGYVDDGVLGDAERMRRGSPLVRWIVEERLGGTLTGRDTPGGGTTLEIRFPASPEG